MPLFRFHLDSHTKVVADAPEDSPAKLAEIGNRDGFIAATITTGEPSTEFIAPTRVAIPFRHVELIEML